MRGLLFLLLACNSPVWAAASDMPGHAALHDAAPCQNCHGKEAAQIWSAARDLCCTPYCQTCHPATAMNQHHPIGTELTRTPAPPLPLTATRRTACFTCHDLSRPRFATVRWKAESLFGRLFRRQAEFKTYYLTIRNDRGQLCLACH